MLGKSAALGLPAARSTVWGPEREDARLDQNRAMDRFLADVERRALRITQYAVGDRDEAMDIVQDAMISLVRGYAGRPGEEWRPLFFRILTNRITDHQRRRSVRRRVLAWFAPGDRDDDADPIAELPDDGPVAPDRMVEQDAAMAALEIALQALPARQREAFLLRSMEGLDVAETAATMGCTEGSVKTHYSRAVHSLRLTLGEHWS